MGYLIYDSVTRISFDDRVLAHLEAVIMSKLRRREAFPMTWREPSEGGDGRTTVLLDISVPLRFHYDEFAQEPLDHAWIDRLNRSAGSARGMTVTDENGDVVTGHTREPRI